MSKHWNYRILAKKINNEVQYGIYEVHYEDDIPVGYTSNSILPSGFDNDDDPIESLKWQLDAMKLATEKPVLDYDNFPNEYLRYSRRKKLNAINEFLK